ncbi:MAG: phage holin family protein [Paludibacter sp.]|jgi:hypothetical protein
MADYHEPIENFQQLYTEIKKYLSLETEYIKVDFVEKLSIILSTLFIMSIIIVMVISTLLFFFFALAYALESVLGSLAISFGVISLCYVLLIVLFYAFRKKIIINPIVRFLTNLFLTK